MTHIMRSKRGLMQHVLRASAAALRVLEQVKGCRGWYTLRVTVGVHLVFDFARERFWGHA